MAGDRGLKSFDVVVVGSGAAGAMAALRSAEQGLKVLIVEKAHKFGGTSATSGGVMWVPNHDLTEAATAASRRSNTSTASWHRPVQRDRLEAFVDEGAGDGPLPKSLGIDLMAGAPGPTTSPPTPGARSDRSDHLPDLRRPRAGRQLHLMREQYTRFKLFRRYSMDLTETFSHPGPRKGWQTRRSSGSSSTTGAISTPAVHRAATAASPPARR